MATEIQNRKEQLEKELSELSKLEEKEMIAKNYPIIKKQFEGKYFKVQNRYSSDKHWWLYTKVVQIKPEDVYDTRGNGITAHFIGWTFQTDCHGQITIEKERYGYVHNVGQQITEREFNAAWNKMIDKMNQLP